MKALKSASLLLCLTLAACSSADKKTAAHKADAPVAAAAVVKIDGAWLDDYEARLRDAVKGSHFEVERRGDLLLVVAPVKNTFNADRPNMLLPATLAPITRIAKLVEKDDKAAVMIFGHADTSGDAAANRTLSGERAGAFGAIFRLSGLKHDRLLIQGMGSDLPRADNASKQGRAKNRRVELVLTPVEGLDLLYAQYQAPLSEAKPVEATQLAKVDEKAKAKK